MTEKLSGTVAEAESFRPTKKILKPGVLLRPVDDWCEPIVVGEIVKLVLSNGNDYHSKVLGLEIENENSRGILVDDIDNIENESLLGARLYVFSE